MTTEQDTSGAAGALQRFEDAITLRENGAYDDAIAWLRRFIERNEHDVEAYALLAHCLSLREQNAEAWSTLQKAQQLDPSRPSIHRNLARLFLKRGEFGSALKAAQAACSTAPSDPENALALAAALGATGEVERAMRATETVIRENPNYAEAYLNRAALRLRTGDGAGAARDLETALSLKPHVTQAWVLLANLRQRAEDLAGAADALERSLAHDTDNLETILRLAGLRRSSGDSAGCAILLERARALDADNPEILNGLGAIAMEAGDHGAAESWFRRCVERAPESVVAHKNLGVALLALDRYQDALGSFEQAVALDPTSAEAHSMLGAALIELERPHAAHASCKRAVELDPKSADALSNLGVALQHLGRFDEAMANFERALELNPGSASIHAGLAALLEKLGRPEQAIAQFEQVLALAPNSADAHFDLANAHLNQGERGVAMERFRQTTTLRPTHGAAHRCIASATTYASDDAHLRQMIELHAREDLRAKDRMHLCFALGKAKEDIGAYAEAYEHFAEGNRLRRAATDYSSDVDRALFAEIKRAFPAKRQSLDADAPSGTTTPIFIVGMPRSGTTLVEQILSSHSAVYGAGELTELGSLTAEHLIDPAMNGAFSEIAAEDLAWAEAIAAKYADALNRLAPDHRFVTDKMPQNFRWIGVIKTAMPTAKIVNLLRDPRDVCLSIFKNYFAGGGVRFSSDLDEIAEYFRLYTDLMAHWRRVYPGEIYDISYEALTRDQEQETRALLEYCGLDWQEACLDFHKTDRQVLTASRVQVRQKLNADSVALWKRYGEALAPLLTALEGVETTDNPPPDQT